MDFTVLKNCLSKIFARFLYQKNPTFPKKNLNFSAFPKKKSYLPKKSSKKSKKVLDFLQNLQNFLKNPILKFRKVRK